MFLVLILLLSQTLSALANTEKAIFLGPSPLHVPIEHPTLEDLHLDVLTPVNYSLRTHIQAEFPTGSSRYGQSTWLLLHGLQERQRYEVRICWAATQPTSFRLDTYELPTVFETPDLITSLAKYSETRQPTWRDFEDEKPSISTAGIESTIAFEDPSSILFLHVQAAADYYTMNKTLMEQVPPVFVDIILDPFVFNVFPRSLIPTAVYILVLAVGSWVLSKHISRWLTGIANHKTDSGKKTR
ncbi:hypothetical protein D0Z07_5881 [Hyphodiscus hymeniophilus]|uniref:Uncharacterized protein n=1 Tax=Hyphodiscus hymeniophilus TaxID=353542 RepID=A0A9P7AWA2_9HELO|nr:hypothetical protein D0Z07_5881 [Hyphodiscus hymeniophilus]